MARIESTEKLLEKIVPRQVSVTETTDKEGEVQKVETLTQGVAVVDHGRSGVDLEVLASAEQVVDIAVAMAEHGFFLESVTGVDWIKEDQMEVIYDYNRMDKDQCRVMVRARIPRDTPKIPTICEIHPGGNWHERETHDFFGIKFQGHPDLSPLLLPEDADFHPLLKDFKP
ncbi:MAG: NADH-quinone oxidoreductase subunit C [Desulfobulbaceae bacterium]|nr:NADH-quinone oxidoreductase subunit C [Desulfobulbaceae bacterium]